jgi:parvulin-like peptidyl-prolyl isomerase
MKLKSLIFLLLLYSLLLPPGLIAKEKEEPFTLNGKPVPEVIAKVNGVPLGSEILERELFAFRFRARQMEREIKPAEEITIARELLKSAVARELIVQKAKSLGITITEEKINRQFENVEDQFPSHSAFLTSLAFQHMSIAALKEKIHRTLLEDELMRQEIAPKVEVSDEETKKYYEDNKARFAKPVLYRVRHIHVATIKPSGDAEDEASREKAERLTKMINEEAKEKINSILKKVEAGEDFAQLAKRFSEDEASREKEGFLGDLHPDSTIPEIGKEMVKLNEEETSGIIQSQFGYHILKLDEIIPSQLIPFSETKTDIMNLLLKMKTRELFETYVEDLGKKAEIQVFI